MIKYRAIVKPECVPSGLLGLENAIYGDDYSFGDHGELMLHNWDDPNKWTTQEVVWILAPGMWLSVQRIEVAGDIDAIVTRNIEEN